MHLTPDQLIDLAEGAPVEAAMPHLRSCELCRHQIAELRSAMSAAADVNVPEPSPLFWEHLSARVREAVDTEGSPRSRFDRLRWWKALPWPVGTVAAMAAGVTLAVYLSAPGVKRAPAPVSGAVAAVATDGEVVPLEPFGAADDPSLSLVADLTSQMDLDAAAENGWNHVGAVDEAVVNLTDDERLELQRLLKEVLSKPGA